MNAPGLLAASLVALAAVSVPAWGASNVVQITLTQTPTASYPGTMGGLTVAMKNLGSSYAYSVVLQAQALDAGIQVNTTSQTLGNIGPNQTATLVVPFSVPAATSPGFYRIQASVSDCISSDCSTTVQVATISVRAASTLSLAALDRAEVRPGTTNNLNLTLTNTGAATLSNIEATWSNPEAVILPMGGGNAVFVASLAPHQSATVPLRVSTPLSATPGVYALNFVLRYGDAVGTGFKDNATVGVRVGGDTDFSLSIASGSGATSGLNVNVANVGVNVATSVVVAELGRGGNAGESVFVGTLNPGDFTVATFSGATGGGSGNRSGGPRTGGFAGGATGGSGFPGLRFQISYTDASGVRRTAEKDMAASAFAASGFARGRPAASASPLVPMLEGGALGVVAAGVVAVVVVRRQRTLRGP